MTTPCSKCKYNNTTYCTGPCETFKKWRENPEKIESEIERDELLPGIFWVSLDLHRENVCMQDCLDLTRTMRVRSDTKMADIDDELRRTWLPKGYTWDGGVRNGIAGDSPFRNRTVTYTLRKK